MPYQIRVSDSARRELLRLPGHVRQRVRRLIEGLAANPTPGGARALRGREDYYRIRLLRWRVIYRLDAEAETAFILAVREKEGPETYEDIEH